jgi:hypothetical protein
MSDYQLSNPFVIVNEPTESFTRSTRRIRRRRLVQVQLRAGSMNLWW